MGRLKMLKKMIVSLFVCTCGATAYAAPAMTDKDVNCAAYSNSLVVLTKAKAQEVENAGGNPIGYQAITSRALGFLEHHFSLVKKKMTDKKLDSEDVDSSLGVLVGKYNSELESIGNDPAALLKSLMGKEKSFKCSLK